MSNLFATIPLLQSNLVPAGLALPLLMARGFLVILLLVSGADKLWQHEVFTGQMRNYRLLPHRLVPFAALAFPLAELVAALVLASGLLGNASGLPALALLSVATLAVAINLGRGRDHIDCGCGGPGGQPISAAILGRNGLLMVLSVVAGFIPPFDHLTFVGGLLVALGSVLLASLYFLFNQMIANHLRMLSERA